MTVILRVTRVPCLYTLSSTLPARCAGSAQQLLQLRSATGVAQGVGPQRRHMLLPGSSGVLALPTCTRWSPPVIIDPSFVSRPYRARTTLDVVVIGAGGPACGPSRPPTGAPRPDLSASWQAHPSWPEAASPPPWARLPYDTGGALRDTMPAARCVNAADCPSPRPGGPRPGLRAGGVGRCSTAPTRPHPHATSRPPVARLATSRPPGLEIIHPASPAVSQGVECSECGVGDAAAHRHGGSPGGRLRADRAAIVFKASGVLHRRSARPGMSLQLLDISRRPRPAFCRADLSTWVRQFHPTGRVWPPSVRVILVTECCARRRGAHAEQRSC